MYHIVNHILFRSPASVFVTTSHDQVLPWTFSQADCPQFFVRLIAALKFCIGPITIWASIYCSSLLLECVLPENRNLFCIHAVCVCVSYPLDKPRILQVCLCCIQDLKDTSGSSEFKNHHNSNSYLWHCIEISICVCVCLLQAITFLRLKSGPIYLYTSSTYL